VYAALGEAPAQGAATAALSPFAFLMHKSQVLHRTWND
jgi:hypothetical protein